MELNKNIRNYLFLIIVTITATLKVNAGGITTKEQWHEKFGPGFQIQNKSNSQLSIIVSTGKKFAPYNIQPNKTETVKVFPEAPLEIQVYTSKQTNPDDVYTIDAKGKTKYLTWNPNKYNTEEKYLYPQTGTYGGLTGKTATGGYSLSNNVTQANIKYHIY